MKKVWEYLTSLRTAAILLSVLSGFLVLNVILPQEGVLGEEGLRSLAQRNPVSGFFLLTLGLGHIPTSPLFLATLGLFFLTLAAVLVDRAGATLRRIEVPAPGPDALERMTRADGALDAALPEGWDVSKAMALLRGCGYRPARVGDHGVWGVRHRTAPAGFLLFHGSFFVLCAGGALLFYTRFAGKARLVEGQTFEGQYQKVIRMPPVGGPPGLAFTVTEIRPTFQRGEPTDLRATLRFAMPGGSREMESRVNHPARWGSVSVLVEEAGVAPELWVQTPDGFTLDRVSVAATTKGSEPTTLTLAGGRISASLEPLWPQAGFPERAALRSLPLRLALQKDGAELWRGELRPGQALEAGGCLVRLVGHRYWVGARIVSERGGGLLMAGFCLAVMGLVWRLIMYRREVGLTWDGNTLRLGGRAEFFHGPFRDEIESLLAALAGTGAPGDGPRERSGETR